jgi:HSP20 family protein
MYYELRSFGDMDREIDRFIDQYQRHKRPAVQFGAHHWRPLVDLFETPDMVVALVELAGVDQEQLDVVVEGTVLTVRGRREQATDQRPSSYHIMEINHGPFERAIQLPTRVDGEQTRARMHEGMLEICMPKVRAQQISVTITSTRVSE